MSAIAARRGGLFPSLFWTLLAAAIPVLLAAYYVITTFSHRLEFTDDGAVRVKAEYREVFGAAQPRIIEELDIALDAVERRSEEVVGRHLAELFAGAEANVSAYADFHYSVVGEYTELAALGAGDLASSMQERIFGADFDERAAAASAAITEEARVIFGEEWAAYESRVREITQFTPRDVAAVNLAASEISGYVLSDATERFSPDLLAGRTLGAGAAGFVGARVGGRVTREFSERFLRQLGRRAIAKGAGRASGLGGGASAGAAVGSVLGPVGAAVGGVAGAIIGWVATDAVIIELDELFSRDEFERDLLAMVTRAQLETAGAMAEELEAQLEQLGQGQSAIYQCLGGPDGCEAQSPRDILLREG